MKQGNEFADLIGMMICVLATLGSLVLGEYLFGYIGAWILFANVMISAVVSVLASKRGHCPIWYYLGSLAFTPLITFLYLRGIPKSGEPIGRGDNKGNACNAKD